MKTKTQAPVRGTALALTFVASLAALGCGSNDTSGKRLTHAVRFETAPEALVPFVTPLGWEVSLEQALMATGPLYLFSGPPAFARAGRQPNPRGAPWHARFWIKHAFAHPGHDVRGEARGQLLDPFSVDLLAGPTMYPALEGVTGAVASAAFSFSAPTAGPAAPALGGATVAVRGRARRGERQVVFSVAVPLAEIEARAAQALVQGCTFDATQVQDPGTVVVTIRPQAWFTLVDFSDVPDGSPEAPSALVPESTARLGFTLGLVQVGAYHFSFVPPLQPITRP